MSKLRAELELNLEAKRTLGQSRLTTSGLAKDASTSTAEDNGLGMRENGGDGKAA